MVWKTIPYSRHELYACNNATDSIQLQYEYDGAPMSDLHSEGDNIRTSGYQELADEDGNVQDIHNGRKDELTTLNHAGTLPVEITETSKKRSSINDGSKNISIQEMKTQSRHSVVEVSRNENITREPPWDYSVGNELDLNREDVMDYYHGNNDGSRTVTDDLYREVTIHSQCLLVSPDRCRRSKISKTKTCLGNYKSDIDSSSSEPSVSTSFKAPRNTTTCNHPPEPYTKLHRRHKGNPQKDGQRCDNAEKKNENVDADTWELIHETPPELVPTEVKDIEVRCTCRHAISSPTDNDQYSCTISHIPTNKKHVGKVVSLLSVMDCIEQVFDIVVVVLQTSPLKKILLKHGVNVGHYRNVASMMVGDETKFYVDISLWGDHASWVERLSVGDVILLQDISFHWYRNAISGRATKTSRLYNFHRPQLPYPSNWSSIICMKKLQRFCWWLKRTHNFLNSPLIAANSTETVMTLFDHLSCEHLNHLQGKIINLSIGDDKSDLYLFLGMRLPKVAVELQDKNCVTRTLFVWGTHHRHVEELKKNVNRILKLTSILQKFDKNTNTYSLHTSEKSDFKILDLEEEDIETITCTINYIQFETDSGTKLFLSASNIRDCDDLSGLLYTGCTVCGTPLLMDSNQVYQRCQMCVNGLVGEHFSMFTLNVRKANDLTQQGNNSTELCCSAQNTSSNRYRTLSDSNSFDVLVYPEKACKVFPQFFDARRSGFVVELLQCLRDEMESHLCGKTFDLSLKVVQYGSDGDSFASDKSVLVDMVST